MFSVLLRLFSVYRQDLIMSVPFFHLMPPNSTLRWQFYPKIPVERWIDPTFHFWFKGRVQQSYGPFRWGGGYLETALFWNVIWGSALRTKTLKRNSTLELIPRQAVMSLARWCCCFRRLGHQQGIYVAHLCGKLSLRVDISWWEFAKRKSVFWTSTTSPALW